MDEVATVTVAWAAVLFHVGLYDCSLFSARRSEREYLWFGLLAFALGVSAVGSALLIQSESLADGYVAMQVRAVGVVAALPFFIELSASGWPRLRMLAYVISGIGLVMVPLELMYSPDTPAEVGTIGFASPHFVSPAVTPTGDVYFVATLAIAAAGLVALRRRWDDRDARLFFFVGTIGVAASLHDVLLARGLVSGYPLLEHTTVLFVGYVSYGLLMRFARTREALRRRTAELKERYEELRQTQEELVRKEQLAAVGELSAVIAHEVRNPLAIIKNAVASLRRVNIRPSDRQTLIGILDEEVGRLHRLAEDLLTYASPVESQLRTVDMASLARHVLDLALDAKRAHMRVAVHLELDGAGVVSCDPNLVEQALLNIVENALQAMPSGGTLRVKAFDSSLDGRSAVTVEVTDDGSGMDEAIRRKAKDPFFTTRPSGTGLGLAIVERVITAHKGKLGIRSARNLGTTLTVTLPRIQPAGSAESLAAAREAKAR